VSSFIEGSLASLGKYGKDPLGASKIDWFGIMLKEL
jgi:hypothetical protein